MNQVLFLDSGPLGLLTHPQRTEEVIAIADWSSAFKRGIKWGLVQSNPVTDSDPPTPSRRKGLALTPVQQTLVVDGAGGPWCLSMFLEMSAATGARRGEVLAFRWADVHDGRILIGRSLCQTKTRLFFKEPKTPDGFRAVTLPASVLAELECHRKQQNAFRQRFGPDYRADLDLIFCNPDGTPLKPDSVSASISALCQRLKLPRGASLHTLRHTHGSHLLAAGMELPAVSERLGHSSPEVTARIYSHAIRGRDDEAARKWEEFQGRNSPETSPDDVQ